MAKIPGGYILQPRKFDGSKASKMSPVTRELWFYLLRNVNHKPYNGLLAGQKFFRFSDIQEALSWQVGYRKMVYSKPQLTKALRRLCEGNMTATMKATHGIIITVCNYLEYQDPKNYEGNDEGSTKDQRRKSEGNNIYKNGNKNDNIIIYSRVINYLNKKTNKNFKDTSQKTRSLIDARLNEGFVAEDFKKVIDVKTKEWLNDVANNKYLRPETLFGTKFEGYLNDHGGSDAKPKIPVFTVDEEDRST